MPEGKKNNPPEDNIFKLAAFFKKSLSEIGDDIRSIRDRDPAAKSNLEVALTYSGFHAVLAYRISHAFYKKKHFLIARIISQSARFFTGIEIHPGATIGKGLFIDHGSGVVIGETSEIGNNCTIYQGVTLGGTGKDTGKRHPTLGNNVMIGSGARVLGPFKVGDNAKVAANAVVLKAIPPNSTAVGIPARVVKIVSDNNSLDQINIPDPITEQICKLNVKIQLLEERIAKWEKQ